MARSSDNNSAGSQFFICLDKASNLDGEYAAFGKVIDGFDVVNKIVANERVKDVKSILRWIISYWKMKRCFCMNILIISIHLM